MSGELGNRLEHTLDLATLQDYVAIRSTMSAVALSAAGYFYYQGNVDPKVEAADNEVIFRAHALKMHDKLTEDQTAEDESIWVEGIQESVKRVSRQVPALRLFRLPQFDPRHADIARWDLRLVLKALRTTEGKRVWRPNMPDFAERVDAGEFVLPGIVPVTTEEVELYAGRSRLGTELQERLAD